jgi:hypothetical protein
MSNPFSRITSSGDPKTRNAPARCREAHRWASEKKTKVEIAAKDRKERE